MTKFMQNLGAGIGHLKRTSRSMDVNEISMGGDVNPVSTIIEIF